VWRQAAENVAESLQKGMRVVVQGRLKQRSYETREGEKRTVVELDVEEVGPSLKYATAKVARVQRSGGGGGYNSQGGGGDDPWASSPAQAGQQGGQSGGQPQGGGQGGGQGGSGDGNQGGAWGGQQGGGQGGGQPAQQNDPWASGGSSDEPPF
jgi:single-strand DNA-binding protein